MRPPLKKWLKIAAWLGLAGAAGFAAALFALSRPGVQRGLALEGLRRAGWTGDIREVTVSYTGRLNVAGVDLKDPTGRSIICERASGVVSWGGFVFGLPHIHRLDATGVSVDFAAPSGADVGEGGATAVTVSPSRWRIDAATFTGRVILPGGAWRGKVTLDDCAFARGGRVAFDLVAEGAQDARVVGDASVSLGGVVSGGDWRAVWRALKPKIRAEFMAHPSASGPSAARCVLTADTDAADVRAETPGGGVSLGATFSESGPVVVAGRWALRREAFLPWVSENFPTGDSRGLINVTFDPVTFAGACKVSVSAAATSVPADYSGPRRVQIEADLSRAADGAVTVSQLAFSLGATEAAPTLAATVSGLRFAQAGWAASPAGEVRAEITARALPVDWLAPVVGDSPFTVMGGRVDGRLRVRPSVSGALLLESVESPVLRAARVDFRGLSATDVVLKSPLRAVRDTSGRVTLGVHPAELTLGGHDAVRLDVDREVSSGGVPTWRLSGHVTAALARLRGLPSPVARLASSRATLNFKSELEVRSGRPVPLSAGAELSDEAGMGVVSARYEPAMAGAEPVWRISFHHAPAQLFPDVIGGRRPYGMVESGELSVATDFSRVGVPPGGAPLVLRDFGWADADGCIRMAPTDATVSGAWKTEPSGWMLGPMDVRVGTRADEVLAGGFTVRRIADGYAGEARLTADLPRLRAVFPSAGLPLLDSGRFFLDGRLSETGELASTLAVSDARLPGRRDDVDLEAALQVSGRDGVRSVRAPIRFSGLSGVSEALLTATASRASAGWVWDGSLRCDALWPGDWAPLWLTPAAVHLRSSCESSPDSTPVEPCWRGHTGAIRVRVGEVRWGGESWRPPEVSVKLSDGELSATLPESHWHGGRLSADAAVRFVPGATPYVLRGELRFSGMPSDVFFTSLSPDAAGWVAGDFAGQLTVSADAGSLPDLREKLRARLAAESGAGTIRLFRADNEALRMTGDIVDVAGTLAGDLGTLLGKRDKRAAGMADAVATLRDALAAMRYERCALVLERDEAGSLEVPSFTLVSEALRLQGRATLSVPVGAGFFNRMATGELRVEARGEPAAALHALGRIESEPDSAGWCRGPLLRYDGALDNLRNNLVNNLFRALSQPPSDAAQNNGATR